ncbi:aspartate/glutamate racemase family protein [Olleya sp. HaHaR_3_96]|uniref:aspartate/glutamate racemase family protein n=1 Tax=Olleya sp. HaHaR_3_96 TaxID=2745560 RepID=UPI001C50160A|nr:aspartate/glutamate racemase family protein [Olleya sp. HaHaR_3_96]QXP59154.1 aspartate/glutamate racemase family protein [Olleya sp. HaHaR_3_96]
MITTKKGVLGILGLGSRSTLFYLEQLNKTYHAVKGDYHTFPSITYSIDFNTINPFLPNQFETLRPLVDKSLKALFSHNIDHCIIPNITLHETTDQLLLTKTILHPLALSIKHLKLINTSEVIVFGSLYTMSSTYILNHFKSEKITVVLPEKEDQISIDNCRKKLYNYSETETDFINYKKLITKYSQNYVVVIACTELSLWSNQLGNSKVIDMALLQVQEAIALSL